MSGFFHLWTSYGYTYCAGLCACIKNGPQLDYLPKISYPFHVLLCQRHYERDVKKKSPRTFESKTVSVFLYAHRDMQNLAAARRGCSFLYGEEVNDAPPDIRRPYKQLVISDQQRRREISLLRRAQNHQDAQNRACNLASAVLSFKSEPISHEQELLEAEPESSSETPKEKYDLFHASKLRGPEVCRWFAKQLMLPEWMIDIPDNLVSDWYAHSYYT